MFQRQWSPAISQWKSTSDAKPDLTLKEGNDGTINMVPTGQVLLSLDKNGRRGTSEPIQWEITVDGVPYCYRCVDPMQKLPAETPAITEGAQWKCLQCGAVIHFNL